jgi:hypothetical protein
MRSRRIGGSATRPNVLQPETVVVGFDGPLDSVIALRWVAALCVGLNAQSKVNHAVDLSEEAHLKEEQEELPRRAEPP